MEFDAFHQWLMLRPLVVFIMALPLLITVFLIGTKQNRRDENGSQKIVSSAASIVSANGDDVQSKNGKGREAAATVTPVVGVNLIEQPVAIETACSAVKMPREWDGAPLRPNFNRQIRLGTGRYGGSPR